MNDPSTLLVGRRILVADDESFSLSIIARMLREMGCNDVVSADSGPRCVNLLDHEAPPGISLAILDFNMPELCGLSILKMIRTAKTPIARDLPVVMLASRIAKALGKPRSTKLPAAYAAVDIDPIVEALMLSQKPVGGAKPRTEDDQPSNKGVKLRLESVPIGAVLAEDFRGPDGELLVRGGTALSERFLRRLRDIAGSARRWPRSWPR